MGVIDSTISDSRPITPESPIYSKRERSKFMLSLEEWKSLDKEIAYKIYAENFLLLYKKDQHTENIITSYEQKLDKRDFYKEAKKSEAKTSVQVSAAPLQPRQLGSSFEGRHLCNTKVRQTIFKAKGSCY